MNYLVAAFGFLLSFHKHGYIAYVALLIILSISPMIKSLLGLESLSIFYALFIGVVILKSLNKDYGRINQTMFLFILIFIFILLTQQILLGGNFTLFALGLIRIIMIPLLCYLIAKEMHSRNKDLFSVFLIYLVILLLHF